MLPIARNIIHMLMEKSLLTQAEVVDGSSIFALARQRNRFCYYKRLSGPSYFIKTGHEAEPGAARSMAAEAALIGHLSTDPAFRALRPYLVKLFDFDPQTSTLISELIEDAQDLTVVAARDPAGARAHLPHMAHCLAQLHSAGTARVDHETLGFDPRPHWIFRLSESSGPLDQLRSRSAAAAATMDDITSAQRWTDMLDLLSESWSQRCLIHGDVKPQNFLVHSSQAAGTAYKMIDWERAALGDPAWDLACGAVTPLMLNAFAMGKLRAPPRQSDLLSAGVKRDMRGFLQSYLAAATPQLRPLVTPERCTQMLIARLLAAAYELNFVIDMRTPLAEGLLGLAASLAQDGAAGDLFATERLETEAA